MESLQFYVQIAPFLEWTPFPVNPQRTINVNDLYRHTLAVLGRVSGKVIPITRGEIKYAIYVVSQVDEESQKLENVSSNDMYRTFIDKPSQTKLMRLFNEEASEKGDYMFKVSRNFIGARVIILAAPRDIARLFYEIPALPQSLDYEIRIYGDTFDELEAIKEYDAMVLEYGETKLALALPMEVKEFSELSRIIFVAVRKDKVIGYCGCQTLGYRTEVLPYMKKLTQELLNIKVEREEADTLSRYFMNVKPLNTFEIEGLSASPSETGKNIGLALLYEALRYIMDPLMKKFYPVTHVASQAASYITKFFLVETFQFRYHGGNIFMNESFVETLGDASKKHLVGLITELVTYYNSFFEHSTKLSNMFAKKMKKNDVISMMMGNVISLYQLYFLLLQSSNARPQSYNAYNTETLDHFIKLFGSLRDAIKPNVNEEKLATYFKVAHNHLKVCSQGQQQCRLGDIAGSIVWPDNRIKKIVYGFMYIEEKKKKNTKVAYQAGYDVIYSVWENITKLNRVISSTTPELETEMAKRTFKMIDVLVAGDLTREKDFNYELPYQQLENILSFFKKLKTPAYWKTTKEDLNRKMTLLDNNETFNKIFATQLYLVDEETSAGFDCFISLDALSEKWEVIEIGLLEKFRKRTVPVTTIVPLVVQNEILDTPEDRETIFSEINALDRLITESYVMGNVTTFFGGKKYTIDALENYYNRLKVLQAMPGNVIEIIDTDDEMEVIVRNDYTIEEFIEEEEEEEIDLDSGVLNQSDI